MPCAKRNDSSKEISPPSGGFSLPTALPAASSDSSPNNAAADIAANNFARLNFGQKKYRTSFVNLARHLDFDCIERRTRCSAVANIVVAETGCQRNPVCTTDFLSC